MTASQRPWLSTNTLYEDYPIYFRRPDIRVAEFAQLQPQYPRLLVITLAFAEVRSNGLPEGDYNTSLARLDSCLTAPFDTETDGLIAVIETFAGNRTYYIYLTPSFDAGGFMTEAMRRFPNDDLSYETEGDPEWNVIRGYADQFKFP